MNHPRLCTQRQEILSPVNFHWISSDVEWIQIAACYRFESIPATVSISHVPSYSADINLSSCRCWCSCKSHLYKLIPRGVTVASQRITNGSRAHHIDRDVLFPCRAQLATSPRPTARVNAIMSWMTLYYPDLPRWLMTLGNWTRKRRAGVTRPRKYRPPNSVG